MLKIGKRAVMLTPDVGQGYLVLNKAEHPDVRTWVIEVNTRTFDQNNQPTDKTLDKVVLKNDINYWSVPEKVSESKDLRFIDVTGFDSNDNPVISEGPIVVSDHPETALEAGGTSMLSGCTWLCNGSYYAWEIQQYVDPTIPTAGPSRFVVEEALNYNAGTQTAVPNYRYITMGEFQASCLDPNGNNLGGYFIPGVPCNPDGIWMAGPINIGQSSQAYPDINGNPTSGPVVYGVGKPLFHWDGGNPISTELTIGNTVCSNDRWWAQSMVNDNPPTPDGYPMDGTGTSYYPELTCDEPVPSGVGDPGSDHEFGEVEFIGELLEWLEEQNDDDEGGRWDNFVHAVVKRTMDDPSFGDGSSWHELIDACVIHDLNATVSQPITVDPNDPSTFARGLSLAPSLYNFGFSIKGLGYLPFILEVEKQLDVDMAMADFLSVSIYPVPISSNSFSIDMTANEALDFKYEFRDGNGVLLYSETFKLKKNQQWTHVVKPKNGVPTGNHINRFVFADGSVLSLQTIK